ncbi:stalk domain-containing protein [Tepidimicrobium xylanilyticum]
MKNFVKGFLVATLIFAVTLTGFAASKLQTIEVELNPATIYVEWDEKEIEHFIHKGTTYVPLRSISEMLDTEVEWDGEEKTIRIYKINPREYSIWSFSGYTEPIIDAEIEVVDSYVSNFFKDLQSRLIFLLDYIDMINIVDNSIEKDTFIELQIMRDEIENRLYMESLTSYFRTPIYYTLEVLDNIELALIRSYSGDSPESIQKNLEKARKHVSYMLSLGF